nr:IclR family transcriptional regulator [Lysinibacillus timonensis]
MPLIQSVSRALEILQLFDENHRSFSIKEISTKLDLNKSTVHSILKTLKHYGYIIQDSETAEYSLGWSLYERGNLLMSQIDIKPKARKHLMKLNQQTNETVHLVIRVDSEPLYIDKINGNNTIVINSSIGRKVNLHSSAVGKILMAYLEQSEIDSIMKNYDFKPTTGNTILNYNDYLTELENVRSLGYAVDNEENEAGIYCLSMPVYDYTQKVVAAISVSSPTVNFTETKKKEILDYLERCTLDLSMELGYKKY